jgi:hypothetical protein
MLHAPNGVEYERFVVVTNPKSRHADRMQRHIAHLKEKRFGTRLVSIETPSANIEETAYFLGEKVRPGDAIGVGAGDGTLRQTIEALLYERKKMHLGHEILDPLLPYNIRQNVVLPLWGGGNICDGARSVSSRALRKRPDKILQDGAKMRVRPLSVQLEGATRSRHLAVLYAGLGMTAFAMQNINARRDEAHDEGRFMNWIKDRWTAYNSIRKSEPFQILDDTGVATYAELLCNNGPRMAGILRPEVILELPEWRATTLADKCLRTIAPTIGKMLLGQPVGTRYNTEPRGAQPTKLSFQTLDDIPAQLDGDTMVIPSDTFVTIGPHTEAFNIVTML